MCGEFWVGELPDGGPDLVLWGKSRGLEEHDGSLVKYPLVCHLLDTAALAGAVWDDYLSLGLRGWLSKELGLSAQESRCFVMFMAGVHDVGKASPGFQRKVAMPNGYPQEGDCTDHARAGHLWIGAALQHKLGIPRHLSVRVGEIVGGHHGVFTTADPKDFKADKMKAHGLGIGAWGRQRLAHLEAMRAVLGFDHWPREITHEAQVIVCAIVVLADWLASRTEYVKLRLPDVPEMGRVEQLKRFFDGSGDRASAELQQAGLTRLQLKPGTFVDQFGFEPNRLQRSLESGLPALVTGPGLLIMAEQTGQGKTEAALFAAGIMSEAAGSAGLSFLLPTMATSNEMEPRLASFLKERVANPTPLNLLHSMAWLRRLKNELEQGDSVASQAKDMLTVVTEWLSGGKKAAFAPVSVGTIDQALLSVLPIRHNAFRMLAFANKTIIIDEVHAFDEYVEQLLSTFLAWCGHLRVPVILMSATLPQRTASRLTAAYLGQPVGAVGDISAALKYPGWRYVDLESQKSTSEAIEVASEQQRELFIEVHPCGVSDSGMQRMAALKTHLAPLLDSRGSAAVICTTVDEAQQTYLGLKTWLAEQGSDAELILLHARMPLHRRDEITSDIVRRFGKKGDRGGRTIIVSTQVIEQSVDIDMDLMVTDLAPLELLFQRAGRGCRHPENDAYRPKWVKGHRLVVLTPQQGDELALPGGWIYVYPEAAMIRTHRLITGLGGLPVQVPGEVQDLVDTVHTDPSLIAGHENAEVTSKAYELVAAAEAIRKSIPRPGHVSAVQLLSKGANVIDDEMVSTRFNADSVRVLPCFRRDGNLYFDEECEKPVPAPRWRGTDPIWLRSELASIIEHTIPLRTSYVDHEAGLAAQPDGWSKNHLLKRVIPLIFDFNADGDPQPVRMRGNNFRLDAKLGLLR
ncbi:CRISPR-associated Cas3 family helicase [Stackebrandtia endophytica]|uniref:CRISPR-associated Cas3 family helicase n=1 Tax=Stackebrandtia endophytica TaxID=1496996 RepID=A0A543ASB3_9ACTN|nr:CRISPR-associated Cas3 family helicase [Stackebrandtia endophytica]